MVLDPQDKIEANLLTLAVAVVAGAVLSVYARGDERFTVTVHDAAPVATKVAKKRPTVSMYSTANCQSCQIAKRDLKAAKDLPFDVIFDAKPTFVVESFPTFHWQSPDEKSWQTTGWDGLERFTATWKATQSKQSPTSQASSVPTTTSTIRAGRVIHQDTGYRARWTYPGEIRQHLRTVHGVTESMTTAEAERVHDLLHDGYTANQIRAYARRNGLR